MPPTGPHVYSVPRRFGLTSIFALTTLMALLFGSLRRVDAHPSVYFCLGVLVFAVCVVQMYYTHDPRIASVLAGAAVMPVCFAVCVWIWAGDRFELKREACGCCGSLFLGSFAGYLGGACLAGIFLVQDLLENRGVSPEIPLETTLVEKSPAKSPPSGEAVVPAELLDSYQTPINFPKGD